jgi:citrate lyase subunit beta/citryl-CoA lyase
MAESPELLSQVARQVDTGVLALIETAAGVLGAREIAAAPGVVRLALGTFDLGAELGVSPDDREAMAWSRGALVLASAAAGIAAPIDGVTGDLEDEELLRSEVLYAARMGFTGKLCIHPRQVGVVETLLQPTEEELGWARAVTEAANKAATEAGAGSAVVLVHGKMVDKPVVDRARRMLERHSPPGS